MYLRIGRIVKHILHLKIPRNRLGRLWLGKIFRFGAPRQRHRPPLGHHNGLAPR